MTARGTLDRKGGGVRRQKKMSSQTQKAPGSNSVTYGSADQPSYPQFHDATTDIQPSEGKPTAIISPYSDRYRRYTSPDAMLNGNVSTISSTQHSQTHTLPPTEDDVGLSNFASRMSLFDIPSQLVDLIRSMLPGAEGEQRGEAFLHAWELPPITKQSLSELDIQNIINNIKLRHDVNFDRDLSFRPNLDGAKGVEKMKAARKYWKALTAELDLYTRLLHGTPTVDTLGRAPWSDLIKGSKKRVPLMFATIQDILKNLVPDRDQSRVDEHLDVAMLMQQIEKGVCDLVRLSEWLAHLLKEHCAPMRDVWVDRMVQCTKDGVAENSSEFIVEGLRELLGILEAMKLDVANHQIRNLRALLIEDTIKFERNYHLSRIERRRINVDGAQRWYSAESQRIRQTLPPSSLPKDSLRAQLDIFVRAVVSRLLSDQDFPETFYLDQDRLRMLKFELYDLVYIEICFESFDWLLKELLHYYGPISPNTRQALRNSLSAIVGEGSAYGVCQWTVNREYISLELVRHAFQLCGFHHTYDARLVQATSQFLQGLFDGVPNRAAAMEKAILPQVLDCVKQHLHSSPIDLFNTLIPHSMPPPPPPPPSQSTSMLQNIPSDSVITSHPASDQLRDLTHRITHIALLHWRTWGPIVYVLPDENDALPPVPVVENVPDGAARGKVQTIAPAESSSTATPAVLPSSSSAGSQTSAQGSRRITDPPPGPSTSTLDFS